MLFRERIDLFAVIRYETNGYNSEHFYGIESVHLTPQSARLEADRLTKNCNNEIEKYVIQEVELKR